MSIKTKEVRICDECKKEITENIVKVRDIPYEGCSEVSLNEKVYSFADSDFCSLECFFDNIKDYIGE